MIVQRKAITSKGLGDLFVGEGDMNEAAPRHWMAEGLGCIQGEVIDAPVVGMSPIKVLVYNHTLCLLLLLVCSSSIDRSDNLMMDHNCLLQLHV